MKEPRRPASGAATGPPPTSEATGPAGDPGLARSYSQYLKVPQLLELQRCLSSPPAHDETLFIIVHQAYELWFKQMLHEIDSILGFMKQRNLRAAIWLYRRLLEIQKLVVQQIGVLETMAPTDFLRFRDHLNPASGFQSFQFRELEFASGLKDARYLNSFKGETDLEARLRRRLEGPTLWGAFEELLRGSGLDFPAIEPGMPEEERARRMERRMAVLLAVYADESPHREIYLLAEAMIEYDENLLFWRWRHIGMVERMIGMKPGTGGSEGVGYLQTTLGKKCFPELWLLRTRLVGTGSGG